MDKIVDPIREMLVFFLKAITQACQQQNVGENFINTYFSCVLNISKCFLLISVKMPTHIAEFIHI